jgi:hypothetical protein
MLVDPWRYSPENLEWALVVPVAVAPFAVVPQLIPTCLGEEIGPVEEPLDLKELKLDGVVNRLDLGIVGRLGYLQSPDAGFGQRPLEGTRMLGLHAADVLAPAIVQPDRSA